MEPSEDWCYFSQVHKMMYSNPSTDWRSCSLISANDEYGLIAIGKNSELHLYKSSDLIASLESNTSLSKAIFPDPITHVSLSPSCSQIAVLTISTLFFLSTTRTIKGGKPISEFKLDSLGRVLDWKGSRLGVLTQSGKLEIFINTQRANQRKEGVKSFCFVKGTENFCIVAGNDGLCILDLSSWNIVRQTSAEGQISCIKETNGLIFVFTLDTENKIIVYNNELDILNSISDVSLSSFLTSPHIRNQTEGFSGFMDFLDSKKTLLFSNTKHSYIEVLYFDNEFALMNFEENEAGKLQMDFDKSKNSIQNVVFGFSLIKSIVNDEVEIFECCGDAHEIVSPPYVLTLSSSGEIAVYKFIDLRAEYIDTVCCERPKKRIEDMVDDMENKDQTRFQGVQDVSRNLFGKNDESVGMGDFGMKKSQGVEENKAKEEALNSGCSLVAGSQKIFGEGKPMGALLSSEGQNMTSNMLVKNTGSNPFTMGAVSSETKPFAPITGFGLPPSNTGFNPFASNTVSNPFAPNTGSNFIAPNTGSNIVPSSANTSSLFKPSLQSVSTNSNPSSLFSVSNNSPQPSSIFASKPENSIFGNLSNEPKNPTFQANPQSMPNFSGFHAPNTFINPNQPSNPIPQNPGNSSFFMQNPSNPTKSPVPADVPTPFSIKEATNPFLELTKQHRSQPKPLFNKDFMHNTSQVENACKIIRNTSQYFEMINKTSKSFKFLKSFPDINKNIRLRLSALEKNINSSSSCAMEETIKVDSLQQTFKSLKKEIEGPNKYSNFSTLLNDSYITSLKKCNDLESLTSNYEDQTHFLKGIKEKTLKTEKSFTGRNSKEEAKKLNEKNIRERMDKIKNDIEKLKRKALIVNGNAKNYNKNITELWDVDMFTYIDPDEHKKLLKNLKKPADSYSNDVHKERINKIVSEKLEKTNLKVSTDINIALTTSPANQPSEARQQNFLPSIDRIKAFFEEVDKKLNFSRKKASNEEEKKISPERPSARPNVEVKIPDKNQTSGNFAAPSTISPNPFSNPGNKPDENAGNIGPGKNNDPNKPAGNAFVKTNDNANPFSMKSSIGNPSSNPFNNTANAGKSTDLSQGPGKSEEVKKPANHFGAFGTQKSAEIPVGKSGEDPKPTGNSFLSPGTTEKTTNFFNAPQGSVGNPPKTDPGQGSSFFVKTNEPSGTTSGFLSNPSQGSSFFTSKTNESQKATLLATFPTNPNQPNKSTGSFFVNQNEGQKTPENTLGNKGQFNNPVGEASKQQGFLNSNLQNTGFPNKPLASNTGFSTSNPGTNLFNKTQEPSSMSGGFLSTGTSDFKNNPENPFNPSGQNNTTNFFASTGFGQPTGFALPSNLPNMAVIGTKAFGGQSNTFTGFGNVQNTNSLPPQAGPPQPTPQNPQNAFFMTRK